MRVLCVGVVVVDGEGRLLLVRRGREPSRGLWSIPGGRVEAGESLETAAVREAHEETGLTVVLGAVLGRIDLAGVGSDVYDVTDFAATVDGDDVPRAGDDAIDVRWVTRDELDHLATSPGLVDHLATWGIWSDPSLRP
jgi:8-oxo-dGTP diphosphatase